MKEHRNALQPGYKLHWYLIKKVLGQGGFGITYLAEDTNLNQLVAIKEFLPVEMAVRDSNASIQPVSGEYGEQFKWGLDRFISEAQTLAQFKHENIVRVFTVFTKNNTAYMVMEYEHGAGLHEILKQRKTLPQDEALEMMMPIMDGLQLVHAAGFIHRDIKPPNIYIRQDSTPVLLDFGSARQSFGQHTRTLTTLISPGYAPFEQYVSKSDKQGPWTDIYGLGATLYRCVTGISPADALDRSEALLNTDRDLYVSAKELCLEGYADEFLQAIDHAMAFRAEDRPQDIASWRLEFSKTTIIQDDAGETEVHPAIAAAGPEPVQGQQTVKISMQVPLSNEQQQAVTVGHPKNWRKRFLIGVIVVMGVLIILISVNQTHKAGLAGNDTQTDDVPPPQENNQLAVDDATVSDSVEIKKPVEKKKIAVSDQLPSASKESIKQTSADVVTKAPTLISAQDRERLAALDSRLRDHPNDKRAARQIREITRKYNEKIKQVLKQGDLTLAEAYVREVLELAPDNKRLTEALRKIQKKKARLDAR